MTTALLRLQCVHSSHCLPSRFNHNSDPGIPAPAASVQKEFMNSLSSFSEAVDLHASAHPTPITKLLYDRKSAAFVLSISVRSLDYLIGNKQLNAVRLGRKVMLTHAELAKFCRSNHFELTSGGVQ